MIRRRRFALSGATVLSLVSLARVALQFATIPVLARLLGPYPYGLMAVAMPIVMLAMQVSDFGLSAMLIREREREAEDTAFWIGAAVALLVTVALVVAAWVAGERVHPEARAVILAMLAMPWLSLFMAVPLARLAREQRLGIMAVGDMLGVVLGLVVAIYGASANWGVWCLVAQQSVLLAVRAFTYITATQYLPRYNFAKEKLHVLVAAGVSLTGSNVFATASRTFDNLLIGVLMGPRPAGAYAMTFQFARLPDTVIGGPVFLSLTAKFARREENGGVNSNGQDALAFCTTIRSLALVATPAMVGLALLAQPVVALLLGPQWDGSDRVLASICGAGLFLALGTVNLAVMTGIGAYRLRAAQSGVQFAAIIAAVTIGAQWDVVAVGWAVTAAYALQFLWAATIISRRLGGAAMEAFRAMMPLTIAAAVMAGVVLQARETVGTDFSPVVSILLFGTIGLTAYIATIAAIRRSSIRDDFIGIKALLA